MYIMLNSTIFVLEMVSANYRFTTYLILLFLLADVTSNIGVWGSLYQVCDIRDYDEAIVKVWGRAIAIRHVDASSCNGCELEIRALSNANYNLEGYGIHFVASPRHADILMVTGPVLAIW